MSIKSTAPELNLHWFIRANPTFNYKQGTCKQLFALLWQLEIWNQGVSEAAFFWGWYGGNGTHFSPSSSLLASFDIPLIEVAYP